MSSSISLCSIIANSREHPEIIVVVCYREEIKIVFGKKNRGIIWEEEKRNM
jgi:hypothetical protein